MWQTIPHIPFIVKGTDHTDPWWNSMQDSVSWAISLAPGSPDEARLVQPRFVYIHHMGALLHQLKHLQPILLPLHQCSFRVGQMIELFSSEIAELKLFLHHLSHLPSTYIDIVCLFDLLTDLPSAFNSFSFFYHGLYCWSDEYLLLFCLFLMFLCISEFLWLFLRFSIQVTNQPSSHTIPSGYFRLC